MRMRTLSSSWLTTVQACFWDFEEEAGEVGGQLEEGTESAAESAEADPPLQGGEEGSEEAETEGAVSVR